MSPVFDLLLMLGVWRCSDALVFETKTVGVGENISLTCVRQNSWTMSHMFWIRIVSGKVPEVLGSTISLDLGLNDDDVQDHFGTKQKPSAFVLYITKTQLTDTAVYYCIKQQRRSMKFMSGTFLRIKGAKPDISAIYQDPLPDPVHPGDAVTLPCSVLSSSEGRSCLEEHHVYWFNTGPDGSPPHLIYAQKTRGDECERNPEAHSLQRCVYSFSKNVSPSDAGTYFCAVAACGEIMIGNGTKLEMEAIQTCDVQTADMAVFLLSAAWVLSLIIIAFLLYYIKKKECDTKTGAVKQETNTVSAAGFIQQRYDDSIIYGTVRFSSRKGGKSGRVRPKPAEETVYSNIRIH